jgi:hypothetical protein
MDDPMARAPTAAHDRVMASVNRPDAGRARDHFGDCGLDDHPALPTNRVSAVAAMAASDNSATSKGPLNAAHTYKAAVVATARPDATPDHGDEERACRSRPLRRRRQQSPARRTRAHSTRE